MRSDRFLIDVWWIREPFGGPFGEPFVMNFRCCLGITSRIVFWNDFGSNFDWFSADLGSFWGSIFETFWRGWLYWKFVFRLSEIQTFKVPTCLNLINFWMILDDLSEEALQSICEQFWDHFWIQKSTKNQSKINPKFDPTIDPKSILKWVPRPSQPLPKDP